MNRRVQVPELAVGAELSSSRLAFMRDAPLQSSGRAWNNSRWITPFPSRTFGFFDAPEHTLQPEVTRLLREGSDFYPATYDVPRPVAVRPANLGSYFLSDPAPFQSYFRVHWEGMFGARANLAEGARKIAPLYNPNAKGRAEGQPLQAYNPWPSASQLGPVYPDAELKAI